MAPVPKHIEDILRVNAHPRFYVRWIDKLDEIYAAIGRWIDRTGLQDDRDEMEKIAAWIVPYLCADPGARPRISDMDAEHFRESWQEMLDDLERMHRNQTLYTWLGMGQSELEHKIAVARKQSQHPIPRRSPHRKILDQGLDALFWRLKDLGKDANEQEFAVLQLFKTFDFSCFRDLSTDKAYRIVHRIRQSALRQPRVDIDQLVGVQ